MLSLFIWQDAQHQHGVIVQRAQQRTALHAGVATADIVATGRVRTRIRLIHRRGAAGAVVAGPAAAQSRAGREPVRP